MLSVISPSQLERAIEILREGKFLAYPTGTSYALGVNATDAEALKRLQKLKGRAEHKPFTILLPLKGAAKWVCLSGEEKKVWQKFSTRPLTILVKPRFAFPSAIQRAGRVGIRTPDYPLAAALAALLPFPITATSANRSGAQPAFSPQALKDFAQKAQRRDEKTTIYLLGNASLPPAPPSTIAIRDSQTWKIVRLGEVTLAEILAAAT
jgi:L-threonylcarbamoyladenylate synthase